MKWITLKNPTIDDLEIGDLIEFSTKDEALIVEKNIGYCKNLKCHRWNTKCTVPGKASPIKSIKFSNENAEYICANLKNITAKRKASDDDLLKIIIKLKKECFRDDIKKLLKRGTKNVSRST